MSDRDRDRNRRLLGCGLCGLLSLVVPAVVQAAGDIVWPSTPAEISVANVLPIGTIESLVNAATEGTQLPHLKVQEFRFACLEAGKVQLIATIDSSGRDLFYAVILVSAPGTTPRFTILTSAPPHLLARISHESSGKEPPDLA